MRESRIRKIGIVAGLVLGAAVIAVVATRKDDFEIASPHEIGRAPRISPDYRGILIPPNVAPLNFTIREPGTRFQVRIASGSRRISISSRDPGIRIPAEDWKTLLSENRGGEVRIEVFAECEGVGWKQYETIVNRISDDPIDPYLVYRELLPQFYNKPHMALKQRCLEDFDESSLLDERQFSGESGCFNCHSFLNQGSDRFAMQLRHHGSNYLFVCDCGKDTLVQVKYRRPGSAYLSWHPSGRGIALAMDMDYELLTPYAGVVPEETLEFVDTDGDVCLYRLADHAVSTTPELSRPDRMETHPAWSADGEYL
jgi:hypothetical protein